MRKPLTVVFFLQILWLSFAILLLHLPVPPLTPANIHRFPITCAADTYNIRVAELFGGQSVGHSRSPSDSANIRSNFGGRRRTGRCPWRTPADVCRSPIMSAADKDHHGNRWPRRYSNGANLIMFRDSSPTICRQLPSDISCDLANICSLPILNNFAKLASSDRTIVF